MEVGENDTSNELVKENKMDNPPRNNMGQDDCCKYKRLAFLAGG